MKELHSEESKEEGGVKGEIVGEILARRPLRGGDSASLRIASFAGGVGGKEK